MVMAKTLKFKGMEITFSQKTCFSRLQSKLDVHVANKKCSNKKILWVSCLVLDRDLHKTSQIEILKALAQRGHKPALLGLYSKDKFGDNIEGVKITAIPMRSTSFLTMFIYTVFLFFYVPFRCITTKVDFVIIEPQSPIFLSLMPMRLLPKSQRPKMVLDIRSTPVDGSHASTLIFNMGVHVAKKFFDGMTIITPMMRTEVCNQFQINPLTVGVWPSGVSTAVFNPKMYDKAALKKVFNLQDKFVVLYHGSMGASYEQVQSRGIVESIKSIKLLQGQYSNVVLYLLGDSRSFPIINKLAAKFEVQDRIILHGRVAYEEVPKYIAMCDVGLIPFDLPIWQNQCPLKLLEYLSMGQKIIATDIPAHTYVVEKCKSVMFIQSSTSEEIAKAISKIYDNSDDFEEDQACKRELAEKKYSWQQVAADFEKYLLTI